MLEISLRLTWPCFLTFSQFILSLCYRALAAIWYSRCWTTNLRPLARLCFLRRWANPKRMLFFFLDKASAAFAMQCSGFKRVQELFTVWNIENLLEPNRGWPNSDVPSNDSYDRIIGPCVGHVESVAIFALQRKAHQSNLSLEQSNLPLSKQALSPPQAISWWHILLDCGVLYVN